MKDDSLYILAIVAVVAVVGLVIMSTGHTVVEELPDMVEEDSSSIAGQAFRIGAKKMESVPKVKTDNCDAKRSAFEKDLSECSKPGLDDDQCAACNDARQAITNTEFYGGCLEGMYDEEDLKRIEGKQEGCDVQTDTTDRPETESEFGSFGFR